MKLNIHDQLMMNLKNPILNTDSYKFSHYKQFAPGTTHVSAYLEARKNPFGSDIVFFGLQMFLMDYLSVPITMQDIDEAQLITSLHGVPFNREDWEYILYVYNGYLPIEIWALPEGTLCKAGDVQLVVNNTDPRLFWLPTYLVDNVLIRATWYPSTVATLSRHTKLILKKHMEKTCDNLDSLPFKLHDFGSRGTTCHEQACIGGTAHLVNFMGTDTTVALPYAREFYGEPMAAFSIPAGEHSNVLSWGKDREWEYMRHMIETFDGEGKIFAFPLDTYDLSKAIETLTGEVSSKFEYPKGTIVGRFDSGDPVSTPVNGIIQEMAEVGYSLNTKGYRMLPPYLRGLQGDGMMPDTIDELLTYAEERLVSADNFGTFGMGAGLLQNVNRDTLSYSGKLSAYKRDDGEWIGAAKESPGKHSKAGYLVNERRHQKVWFNGHHPIKHTYSDIRARAAV